MIIIINGTVGVGKTSVAEALAERFDKSAMLDGDWIGWVHPFEIYDDERISNLYSALAHLTRLHRENGYPVLVINYVFESAESLNELIERLKPIDSDIHTFWLTCAPDELEQRIRQRATDQSDWELKRGPELDAILESAARRGDIGQPVDTTEKSIAEVADKILLHLT